MKIFTDYEGVATASPLWGGGCKRELARSNVWGGFQKCAQDSVLLLDLCGVYN